MTTANLRRTVAGCLLALAPIVAFVVLVPAPVDGLARAGYLAAFAATVVLALFTLFRLTFAIQHPQMPRISGLPPREEGTSSLVSTVHDVLDELPSALRMPIELGRVQVAILSGGLPGEPYASFARIGRAGQPRLIVCRGALERDFGDDQDAMHDRLTSAVRGVLANRLRLDELGVLEFDAP